MSTRESTHANTPVIGLVGGVGSGKSTVAEAFRQQGARVIDADAIGHAVLRAPDVQRQVRERWGTGVLAPDGTVDRRALGRIVFADRAELDALNAIVHPRIRAEMERQIAVGRAEGVRAVVLDAAVLFEAGWDDLCDRVLFVDAPEAQRRERVARTRGWDRSTWGAREKSQIPLDNKRGRCDDVLDNSSSVSHLQERVRAYLDGLIQGAD